MCFELDSLPPVPVIGGAAVSHDDLVLQAADGTELAAFAAAPDSTRGVGVVILPDVRGLFALPSAATTRSRSTTSDGRPASASGATTSRIASMSTRRPRKACRLTWVPASHTSARRRRPAARC